MAQAVRAEWKLNRLRELDNGTFKSITISYNPASKWLIEQLASRNVAFKVINLGCGVKKITTDTNVCSKCGGTGRC